MLNVFQFEDVEHEPLVTENEMAASSNAIMATFVAPHKKSSVVSAQLSALSESIVFYHNNLKSVFR